jgi:hypothetical protein
MSLAHQFAVNVGQYRGQENPAGWTKGIRTPDLLAASQKGHERCADLH